MLFKEIMTVYSENCREPIKTTRRFYWLLKQLVHILTFRFYMVLKSAFPHRFRNRDCIILSRGIHIFEECHPQNTGRPTDVRNEDAMFRGRSPPRMVIMLLLCVCKCNMLPLWPLLGTCFGCWWGRLLISVLTDVGLGDTRASGVVRPTLHRRTARGEVYFFPSWSYNLRTI
jgi:hypothetical protein